MRRVLQTEVTPTVLTSLDARDLYSGGQSQSLLCLKNRFLSDELKQHFSSSHWIIDLLNQMRMLEGGVWLFAEDHGKEHVLTSDHMYAIIKAAGIEGPAQGNVRCTWSIRTYVNSNNFIGGLNWLKRLEALNENSGGIAQALTKSLRKLSEHIYSAGGRLFVEQISLLLSKDAESPTKSLTPVVHADEYYGLRESAILSVFEDGWSEVGSTLFFPSIRPASLGEAGRLSWPDFKARFGAVSSIAFNSGDLVIYDGMAGENGTLNLEQGVPHISGDIAGQSSRLLVLMRHELPDPV